MINHTLCNSTQTTGPAGDCQHLRSGSPKHHFLFLYLTLYACNTKQSTTLLSVPAQLPNLDSTRKWNHTPCGHQCLIPFTQQGVIRGPIRAVASNSIEFLLVTEQYFITWIAISVYSFVGWRISGLFLPSVSNAAVRIHLGQVTGSQSNSSFNCLQRYQLPFIGACTSLYSHEESVRILISSTIIALFLKHSSQTSGRELVTHQVSVCIFLPNEAEHFKGVYWQFKKIFFF